MFWNSVHNRARTTSGGNSSLRALGLPLVLRFVRSSGPLGGIEAQDGCAQQVLDAEGGNSSSCHRPYYEVCASPLGRNQMIFLSFRLLTKKKKKKRGKPQNKDKKSEGRKLPKSSIGELLKVVMPSLFQGTGYHNNLLSTILPCLISHQKARSCAQCPLRGQHASLRSHRSLARQHIPSALHARRARLPPPACSLSWAAVWHVARQQQPRSPCQDNWPQLARSTLQRPASQLF